MALLLNFFGTKVAAALLGGWVLFGHSAKAPSLSPPQMASSTGRIVVSTTLRNGFSDDLNQVILTGTPVTLTFSAALLDDTKSLIEQESHHTVTYDPGTKAFCVIADSETKTTNDQQTMQSWLTTLTNLSLLETSALRAEGSYRAVVQAKLEPISVEAAEGKKFDLMTFWQFRIPKAQSEAIAGTTLLGR
jgi:hypothetical protein